MPLCTTFNSLESVWGPSLKERAGCKGTGEKEIGLKIGRPVPAQCPIRVFPKTPPGHWSRVVGEMLKAMAVDSLNLGT